jgi:hypothetical protein
MLSSSWPTVALLQKGKIFAAAHREADETFARDHTGQHPGDVTVPVTESHWDYNTPGGMQRRTHMLRGHPSWNENRSHKAYEL